jgi:regulator of sigma E protease
LIDLIFSSFHYFFSFILVISVIVFVHELGHYLVARWAGVKIETFSIGFGKEIWGFNDKSGTRWKFSVLPFGGYVKMFGDSDPASNPDVEKLEAMTEAERSVAFEYKPLYKKAAIVAAGPAINFLFAIVIMIYFFLAYGFPNTPAVAGGIMPDSAAEKAGIQAGDKFLTIDGRSISNFKDMQSVVRLKPGQPLDTEIERGGEVIKLALTPQLKKTKDIFGNEVEIGLIGVTTTEVVYEEIGLGGALVKSVTETYSICRDTLIAMWQIITGVRSVDELSGPVKIAQYSGQSTQQGMITVLWFMAVLSINLGLINLFPIPMLDGGHLMYYTVEAIRGRPVAENVQEWGMRIGFALLITLMIFTTVNDIAELKIF